MDHDLVDPFRDFVQLFERLGVRYVLIGGLAVSAFGIPRPTHDLDFTLASWAFPRSCLMSCRFRWSDAERASEMLIHSQSNS